MVSIYESRKIDASLDKVWDIVSDVDRDPEYWSGLSSIRNIRTQTNLVEREVVVGFMGSKATQRILFTPKEYVELVFMRGPLSGSRTIRLTKLVPRGTKIEIMWNVEFSQIPTFAQGYVRSRLEENTHEALERIRKAVENLG